MSGALSGIASGFISGALVNAVLTGSTRQIVWPAVSSLMEDLNALGIASDIPSIPLPESLKAFSASIQPVTGFSGYIAVLEEHRDELEITSHPVSTAASISDHAYKMPANLTMQIGWSTSTSLSSAAPSILALGAQVVTPLDVAGLFSGGGSDIFIRHLYTRFLTLQSRRTLLTIYTGKRIYTNMLLQSVTEKTTEQTEHALILTLNIREILMARAKVVNVPLNTEANEKPTSLNPATPQGTVQVAPAPNVVPSKLPVAPEPGGT